MGREPHLTAQDPEAAGGGGGASLGLCACLALKKLLFAAWNLVPGAEMTGMRADGDPWQPPGPPDTPRLPRPQTGPHHCGHRADGSPLGQAGPAEADGEARGAGGLP